MCFFRWSARLFLICPGILRGYYNDFQVRDYVLFTLQVYTVNMYNCIVYVFTTVKLWKFAASDGAFTVPIKKASGTFFPVPIKKCWMRIFSRGYLKNILLCEISEIVGSFIFTINYIRKKLFVSRQTPISCVAIL